jgi:cell division protease FtsH
MSEVIGLMAVGEGEHEVFLGREISQRRGVSEHTARQVDTEVKRILDEAHETARELLDKERDLLERIAQALLERETLDRSEIDLLDEGKELPPMEKLIIPGVPEGGSLLNPPEKKGDSRDPVPVGVKSERPSPLDHALDRPEEAPVGGEEKAEGPEEQEELPLGEDRKDPQA